MSNIFSITLDLKEIKVNSFKYISIFPLPPSKKKNCFEHLNIRKIVKLVPKSKWIMQLGLISEKNYIDEYYKPAKKCNWIPNYNIYHVKRIACWHVFLKKKKKTFFHSKK